MSHKDHHLDKAREALDQGENHYGEAASHLAALKDDLSPVELGQRLGRTKGWVKTFLRRKVEKAEPAPDPRPKKPAAKKAPVKRPTSSTKAKSKR